MSTNMSPLEEKKSPDEKVKLQDSDTQSDMAVNMINLNHNEGGQIYNPLAGIPRAKLLANVEAFAQEKELSEHTAILQRGALLAQDPDNFHAIEDLSAEEKAAVQNEITHKWSHPVTLYLTIICCSIGAATQGWDQTGTSL
jgi:hypothetical protein